MQINIQSPASLERRIEVMLPSEKVDHAFTQQLRSYQQKAKIPGFRPGKAPLGVIRKSFAGQIGQDLASQWIREGYIKAMEEGAFRPVGTPDIEEVAEVREGSPFSFVIACQVFPQIENLALDGFAVKKPMAEISEGDVLRVVNRLRWNQASFVEKEDSPAIFGDRVVIDFVGKIDGEPFEGGSAEGMPIVLGSGNLIAGFEEQLVGLKTAEEKSVEVVFPENYGNTDLAGKQAVFDVKVQQVSVREIPALDSSLALRFDLNSLDALNAEIQSGLEEEAEKAAFQQVKQQVMDQLFEKNPVELPMQLVEGQIAALWRGFLAQQQLDSGKDASAMPAEAREQFEPPARRMVALGLLVSAIAEQESLEVTNEEAEQSCIVEPCNPRILQG